MPLNASVFVEFRCTRCWYSNCADSEKVGSEVDCRNCGEPLDVPEATPERIERALALLESEPELMLPKDEGRKKSLDNDRRLSGLEADLLRREVVYVPSVQRNFYGTQLASRWSRLFAQLFDHLLWCACVVLGFATLMWLSKQGLGIEDPVASLKRRDFSSLTTLVLVMVAPMLISMLQWSLLASSGQTIGKKILMIRIVTDNGELPGFVRAVIVREWCCFFLCALPTVGRWLGLVDLLLIFTDSRKCLHDYIAGTRVVSSF